MNIDHSMRRMLNDCKIYRERGSGYPFTTLFSSPTTLNVLSQVPSHNYMQQQMAIKVSTVGNNPYNVIENVNYDIKRKVKKKLRLLGYELHQE